MACHVISVEEVLFVVKKCAQPVSYGNRRFKPLYYEGAGWTLTPGLK
jgi:hypothetical protein